MTTRRLELDFCPQPSLLRTTGWVLFAAGIVLSAAAVLHARELSAQTETAERKLRALNRAGDRPGSRVPATPAAQERLRKDIGAANDVAARLVTPWQQLFSDIESVAATDVGLLALEPDAAKRTVRIAGEAKNAQALAGYIEQLEKTASLENVYLTQHERRSDQGTETLRFLLTAGWTAPR